MPTTTGDIATFPGVVARKRKRKKRAKASARWKLVGSAVDEHFASLLEKVKAGDSREGGLSMLRAWFGLGLLKKKLPKAGKHVFLGYKRRKYRITKLGKGRYRITRVK